MVGAFRLRGRLDQGALERALGEVVRRHESLRTRYEEVAGGPVQHVDPPDAMPLEVRSVAVSEGGREDAIRHAAEHEVALPFDLTGGRLLRASLLSFDAEDHALLLCLHHIASDGWSVGVLLRELDALYSAFAAGRPSPLSELPIQYGDYAAWQREWLQGKELERQLDFWRRRLAERPALELPLDHPRPPVQGFRGARRDLTLPVALVDELRDLGQREDATLFMVLLSGFAALLSRYTGQRDVVLGSPVAGRTRSELEGLIGFFVNMQALRVDLSGDPSFRELLGRVRETVLGAQAHQELPFERLVEELEAGRDLSRNPVFQVVFAFQNTPRARLALGDLVVTPVPVDTGTVRFDLECLVTENAGALAVTLRYNTDLFEAGRMERLLGHYGEVLSFVVKGAGERISRLLYVGEEERGRLLGWSGASSEGERSGAFRERERSGVFVPERFRAEAQKHPRAVAVKDVDREWSYGELEERANRLGRYLRRKGVGPEVRVGLCVSRGVDVALGALGILKAGGAYVAVDPELPAERVSWMLRDSGCAVVVTQRVLAEKLQGSEAERVVLDAEWELIGTEECGEFGSGVEGENLAYVIYTSGSTGTPKGVELTHEGLGNLVSWHVERYGLGEQDRGTQLSGLGFDASVWELWPYLASGGSVVFAGAEERGDPRLLQRWLVKEGATVSFVPTPLLEGLLEEEWAERGSLRVLLTGGDRLGKRPRAGFGIEVVNHYGPTESTVVPTSGPVEEQGSESAAGSAQSAPGIGRPITNLRAYVLDEGMGLVGEGIWGELYVGGSGVARGYVGRADLTAESFVPDPYGGGLGERLYRTGDVVRWTGGSLEFGGRRDEQVKLRGYRIELGAVSYTHLTLPTSSE
ncbi:MAG: amino acid adenylation domain-containing protein, partial [Candidatus Eisenbacteria bacterium]|nr:amino acid adenylation domain-containing protein [Candidatus Eisenbacteria bacterium]